MLRGGPVSPSEAGKAMVLADFLGEQAVRLLDRQQLAGTGDDAAVFYRDIITPMQAAQGEPGLALLAFALGRLAYLATQYLCERTGAPVADVLDQYAIERLRRERIFLASE